MRHSGVSQRSYGPRPLGTSCHSPSKLGEKSKEASRTSPPWSGSETGTDDDFPKDFSPVERQRNGGVRPEAGRGRERSEPENHLVAPAAGTDRAPSTSL